nr:vegetative cell wall protein gp1-like isoform X2 [Camelus dromedarius]
MNASLERESPSSPPNMGGAGAPPPRPPLRSPRPDGGSRQRPAHPRPATTAPLPRRPEPAEHSWTQQPPSPAPQQQVVLITPLYSASASVPAPPDEQPSSPSQPCEMRKLRIREQKPQSWEVAEISRPRDPEIQR